MKKENNHKKGQTVVLSPEQKLSKTWNEVLDNVLEAKRLWKDYEKLYLEAFPHLPKLNFHAQNVFNGICHRQNFIGLLESLAMYDNIGIEDLKV